MNLSVNSTNGRISTGTSVDRFPVFYGGDKVSIKLAYHKNGGLIKFLDTDEITIAIGRKSRNEILAYSSEFTLNTDGSVNMILDLKTKELLSLLGKRLFVDFLSIEVMLARDSTISTIGQSPCIVCNNLISSADAYSVSETLAAELKKELLSMQSEPKESIILQAYDSDENAIEGKYVSVKAFIIDGEVTLTPKVLE